MKACGRTFSSFASLIFPFQFTEFKECCYFKINSQLPRKTFQSTMFYHKAVQLLSSQEPHPRATLMGSRGPHKSMPHAAHCTRHPRHCTTHLGIPLLLYGAPPSGALLHPRLLSSSLPLQSCPAGALGCRLSQLWELHYIALPSPWGGEVGGRAMASKGSLGDCNLTSHRPHAAHGMPAGQLCSAESLHEF